MMDGTYIQRETADTVSSTLTTPRRSLFHVNHARTRRSIGQGKRSTIEYVQQSSHQYGSYIETLKVCTQGSRLGKNKKRLYTSGMILIFNGGTRTPPPSLLMTLKVYK
jgi:hypothetical protein